MKVTDFIGVYNVLPPAFCRSSLKKFKKAKYVKHQWTNTEGKGIGSRKKIKEELENYWMNEKEMNLFLPYVTKAVSQYRHNIFSLYPHLNIYKGPDNHQLIYKLHKFRLNRYTKGTNMAAHVDNITSIFDGKEKGIPILSILGILNENYKGGEFIVCNHKVVLNTGDIIIFPSNFMFPHEVKPITQGTRYSFITWGY